MVPPNRRSTSRWTAQASASVAGAASPRFATCGPPLRTAIRMSAAADIFLSVIVRFLCSMLWQRAFQHAHRMYGHPIPQAVDLMPAGRGVGDPEVVRPRGGPPPQRG